jgi:diguanylate cyclase (GGDEF)-like protein
MAAESLSPIDPLAGVLKWQHAEPVFDREITRARRLGQDLGFLLVCIDGAEDLDRRLGLDSATRAIRTIGSHLLRCCRSTDVVLYRGVGQFGVVLPDTSPDLVDVVIRRLVGSTPSDFPSTLLVGTASFPRDGASPAELMSHAAHMLDQPSRQHGPTDNDLGDPPADVTAASQ